MAKDFTPAPWNIERLLPNGSTGFNPYLITANLIVGDYEIAYITESENGEADARLIAAAPDMYEALEHLRIAAQKVCDDFCCGAGCSQDARDCKLEGGLIRAEIALRKARGEK